MEITACLCRRPLTFPERGPLEGRLSHLPSLPSIPPFPSCHQQQIDSCPELCCRNVLLRACIAVAQTKPPWRSNAGPGASPCSPCSAHPCGLQPQLLISCATPDHPCSPCSPTRTSSTARPKFRLFAFWQRCPSVHSVTALSGLSASTKAHNSWLYLQWSS